MLRAGFVLVSLVLVGILCLAHPRPALACAPCETGDPTLAGPGWDLPYRGRIRLAVESRWSGRSDGGSARLDVVELVPSIGASPWDRVTLALAVPIGWRRVAHGNLEVEETLSLGDPELRARVVLLRDRAFAPTHSLSAAAAVDLPVAPVPTGERGRPLSHEAREGSGSADPSFALAYAYRGPPWSVLASIGWRFPTTGTGGWRDGPSAEAALSVAWQPIPELAIRLGADVRGTIAAREDDRVQVGTGGVVVRAAPELAVAPIPDLYLALAVRVPVIVAGEPASPVVSLMVAGEVGR